MKPFSLYSLDQRINARARALLDFVPSVALPTILHVWRFNVGADNWRRCVGDGYAKQYMRECLR